MSDLKACALLVAICSGAGSLLAAFALQLGASGPEAFFSFLAGFLFTADLVLSA